jgi:hypothetical protein
VNKNDDFEFLKILTGMCELYDRKCSDAFIDLYRAAMDGYSIDQFRKAANEAVRKLKFFPKPAELIELIEGGTSGDKAEHEAYGVIERIRNVGSYGTPKWHDPVTSAVMTKRFRWGEVCATPEKDLKWFVREFVAAYKSYQGGGLPEIEHAGKPPAKLIELAGRIGGAPN